MRRVALWVCGLFAASTLVAGTQALTYGEWNRQANRLAHYLRTLEVGPDSLVGLCLERSAPMMVALLAVLKAGGAYVPLNPDNPRPRLAQHSRHCDFGLHVPRRRRVGQLAPWHGLLSRGRSAVARCRHNHS